MYNTQDDSAFNQLKRNKNEEATSGNSCKKCKLEKYIKKIMSESKYQQLWIRKGSRILNPWKI